eukprot:2811-Heterococcus_DN1.PRE.1
MQRALIMYLLPLRLSAAVTPAWTLTSHVGSFLNGSSHLVLLLMLVQQRIGVDTSAYLKAQILLHALWHAQRTPFISEINTTAYTHYTITSHSKSNKTICRNETVR